MNDKEFAIIGTTAGSHFVDTSSPENSSEVALVEGGFTGGGVIQGDYHDINGYHYAVCDEGTTSTLHIFVITDLPHSGTSVHDSHDLFTKSHTTFIDTSTAKLYAWTSIKTMVVYDPSTVYDYTQVIIQSPTNRKLIYSYSVVGPVHDALVRNDTACLHCGYDVHRIMVFCMVDSLGDQPVLLGSLTSYPDAGYLHSVWLRDDGTIFLRQYENPGYEIKILDGSDLSNITILSIINSGIDPNSQAHNGIIKDYIAYSPYYHDGLRVSDI